MAYCTYFIFHTQDVDPGITNMSKEITPEAQPAKPLFKRGFSFLQDVFAEFSADNCFDMSAALSYYTTFSLAPMLVIVVAVTGFFFGEEAMRGEIYSQIKHVVGDKPAAIAQQLIQNASISSSSIPAMLLGIITALIGATTVFSVLHNSLNRIWRVQEKINRNYKQLVKERMLAFSLLIAMGFLLMVSLVVNAVLQFIYDRVEQFAEIPVFVAQLINVGISLLVITGLFMLTFSILSDARIPGKVLLAGAFITTLLFVLGRLLISFYLARSSIDSVYGAAGSLAVLLTWVYYSSLILFFGAEFIKVYARHLGLAIEAKKNAFKIRLIRTGETEIPVISKRPTSMGD